MYLVRETMRCKPGKVRPLVEKFKKMADLSVKLGYPRPRLLTDVSGGRYWTVISEFEVPSLDEFLGSMNDPKWEEAGTIMEGYHDLVDHGGREIFKIEG
jgi:hypothetical protein